MFEKILIANRGEIACRVMETARALGVRTVAVYSDADAASKHVALADEAVHIGGAAPQTSYLLGDRIIGAAQAAGAQAIHPGYGFLSENPDFVEAVEEAGLIFIGPSASAIRSMGLKDAAKALMEKAGVPVVPGYHGDNQNPAFLAAKAKEITYPVLIKAVAGGGGKGMRLVEQPEDFADALVSAQGEATTAFGNPDVLIEKYIQKPRHIEVQVFGDGKTAVHLFERDCSLQRRHQKVIEEAPAPGMTAEMRAAMGQAAVRAAEAIGYKGAGTVEFIVDGSDGLRPDGFWFMEMNTRLQVEHPVTEAITGVDLVEWQLRVAAGETLPMRQEDLTISGHAFEARLYAEDVPKGFLPATGTLTHLTFPDNVRADSGVRAGDTISPWYDPMISKVITHGPTRAAALSQLARALEQTRVAGTTTNLGFLGALARHKGFAAGEVDTGLIARDLETLVQTPEVTPAARIAAAQVALDLQQAADSEFGFSLWAPLQRSVHLELEGNAFEATVAVDGADRQIWTLDGAEHLVSRQAGHWLLAGQRLPDCLRAGEVITVFSPFGVSFTLLDPLDRAVSAGGDAALIEAPMPGLVKAIFAEPGAEVREGDRLAVLEAMKMEHALLAARDGIVAEILAAAGDQVEAGAALVRLEEA
ncbi:Acetyl-/propionyl-coenzyme A carboxylase alpha chain [Tritonibacter multivorans]|uniref:Acetyl-/propionyl-coenzyme A carboxylase alpha chain n=1 Tax=Tritonibacter multivorans TaxID=928856 RepID=A0A0P1GFB3_9RHOB|nr:acetyl/propionyl/methylcrotonyl-CoA carboxylase subunit alpha [Tritonibacter multivorans]MDA7420992.1 acetyl/propionyl/methylcrotonyl-CoA carboxylase subunit alpha [Tritonibacter multivorans]CUH80389.1 Acetyl-/propionyl-coenzyme A carboxylase alpha chain [Tritonibacter multivorans]SFC79264.1 3-methylcrotonoyl-CoA carboxylase, alpha subunit [Tritonibacter multivorans]